MKQNGSVRKKKVISVCNTIKIKSYQVVEKKMKEKVWHRNFHLEYEFKEKKKEKKV